MHLLLLLLVVHNGNNLAGLLSAESFAKPLGERWVLASPKDVRIVVCAVFVWIRHLRKSPQHFAFYLSDTASLVSAALLELLV